LKRAWAERIKGLTFSEHPKRENLVSRVLAGVRRRQPGGGVCYAGRDPESKWTVMRSFTPLFPVMTLALAIAACHATEGDIFRSRPDAATARPRPPALASWQIQLTGTLDATLDVAVYISDLETPTSIIDSLHAAGRIAICYFSGGTMEPFRDDASRFPGDALGAPLPAYPDERWVDVRDPTVRSIMADRIAAAAASGCDGVHPSGLAAFAADTGLGFTRADQLAYDRWLAAAAHARGLSIGLIDADASQARDLLADFDWTVAWSCLDADCPSAAPFVAAGKAAFLIEYGDETRAAAVCPKARSLGLSAIIKRDGNLDAFRVGCP
jgi:hypothetical protein